MTARHHKAIFVVGNSQIRYISCAWASVRPTSSSARVSLYRQRFQHVCNDASPAYVSAAQYRFGITGGQQIRQILYRIRRLSTSGRMPLLPSSPASAQTESATEAARTRPSAMCDIPMQRQRQFPFHRHFINWRLLSASITLSGIPSLIACSMTFGRSDRGTHPADAGRDLSRSRYCRTFNRVGIVQQHAKITDTTTQVSEHIVGWPASIRG